MPGICFKQFNTPSLRHAAGLRRFFHNNAVDTIEKAIEFYATDHFNEKPAVQLNLRAFDTAGIGIDLTPESVTKVGRFLRVISAVADLELAQEKEDGSLGTNSSAANDLLRMSVLDLKRAKRVLKEVGLHPTAVVAIDVSIVFANIAQLLPPAWPARHSLVQAASQYGTLVKLLMVHE